MKITSLVLAGHLLRGRLSFTESTTLELILVMDGCELARTAVGPGRANRSSDFLFPVPDEVFDGAVHGLAIYAARPNAASDFKGVRPAARLRVRFDGPHGRVAFADGYYRGWVTFETPPTELPELLVTDKNGEAVKRVALVPLPKADKDTQENTKEYIAHFQIPCNEIPLNAPAFRCAGVELSGSPCRSWGKPVGLLERIDADSLAGWALDIGEPTKPIELVLRIDGRDILHFRPNLRRLEIARHLGIADDAFGVAGFILPTPEILRDGAEHAIDVEFAGSGIRLRGGKRVRFRRPHLDWEEVAPASRRLPPLTSLSLPRKPLVSIIVLNRNGAPLLAALFASWQRHNRLREIEWIVVDHASDDGSLALLDEWRDRLPLRTVALDVNDSFSASCNRAATLARGTHLLFLNNDIVWLQDALPAMLDTLDHNPAIGAVGLKLLKTSDDGGALAQPQVQHLGVRFKLAGTAYWPYEATPTSRDDEAEYATQIVPAVTAAVMLCSRRDFLSAGGFDPAYCYGFEDVEFCMRMEGRLKKRIVCRNDLVALHRHGYTRLSGRANDIFDRQKNNADVLQGHLGLWLKRAYWLGLLAQDGWLTSERMVVGFVVDANPQRGESTPLLAAAVDLARRLMRGHAALRLVFLDPSHGWFDARDVHVLVVGHPEYDIRRLRNRRADMLAVAWIADQPDTWSRTAWWNDFDVYLAAARDLAQRLTPRCESPIRRATKKTPLGNLLDPIHAPLRVAILAPRPPRQQRAAGESRVLACRRQLRAAGAISWIVPWPAWDDDPRLADARIIAYADAMPDAEIFSPRPDTLDVLWSMRAAPARPASLRERPIPGTLHTHKMPQARWLRRQLEQKIGSTFHPS